MNFKFDKNEDTYYHHEVKLLDTRTKEVFYDKLTFIYLEMPKFNKAEAELETMFDKWLFVLKNLSRLLERPVALRDWYSVLSTAENKGRAEERLEIARNMKSLSLPIETIIQATGLTVEDINHL